MKLLDREQKKKHDKADSSAADTGGAKDKLTAGDKQVVKILLPKEAPKLVVATTWDELTEVAKGTRKDALLKMLDALSAKEAKQMRKRKVQTSAADMAAALTKELRAKVAKTRG